MITNKPRETSYLLDLIHNQLSDLISYNQLRS